MHQCNMKEVKAYTGTSQRADIEVPEPPPVSPGFADVHDVALTAECEWNSSDILPFEEIDVLS